MGINTSFCWCFILVLLWFQSQGCLEEERAALLQIKDSMGSYLSSAFSNWYVKECCDWEGVVCDPSHTRIQRIFFPHLRSDDSEPWFPNATLFAEFKDLRELELPGNHIGGFISIQELRHLDLSGNSFNGNLPMFFTDQLQMLDLSNNQFQGEIPYSIKSNMSCLLYLGLSQNNLTGDLFPKNSSLPNLRWLHLNNNRLSGTFPYALSKSMKLRILDIQNNELSENAVGYLPDGSRNGFVFTFKGRRLIFKGVLLSFPMGVDVSCNRLAGKIPIQMTRLKGIRILNVSNNLLTGQIPSSLGNLENLESLDLSHNNFFGVLPHELVGLPVLEIFNVSFNNLSGMIPIANQFGTFLNDSYLGNPDLCGQPLSIKCNGSTETPPIYARAEKSVSIMYFAVLIGLFFIVICLE
ncbi:hypothetical protein E1A91_D13G070600v1 [Gossypium mustelinum]|uniref:Leucine-rich repeat-containing N-terminal plant-type domain-containing protein n=1 Tax=Gossypium mustelinum TaxID=34275 RepID=A0A5D2S0V7_GOSMU|nr:hypothetical protein E1A91_D13G070600v1 [Gossypium mustelinum]